MSELDFSDLRVVITGASSGIGLGLAQSFAAAGARLVLNGRDERKLHAVASTLRGQRGLALVCGDIGLAQTASAIIAAAAQQFGGADVLINNAGIFFAKPVLDYSEAEIDAFMATNWRGTVLMTQAMVRQLRKQGNGGTIIQITSSISLAPYAQVPASVPNSTKGALNTFTRSLALELAKERIRVHAVAPGIIRTPLHGRAEGEYDGLAALQPVGKIGDVADVVMAVQALVRQSFATGVVLPIDGGSSLGHW